MYPDLHFMLSKVHIDELLRQADNERLAAELPPARRTLWRSAAARGVRGFADWLEPDASSKMLGHGSSVPSRSRRQFSATA